MTDPERAVIELESTTDPWTRRLPGPVRGLTDRFLPRGATILTILTIAYFLMRQVQNRVLANEFGLGTELDVYFAAVRIPEIALDLLVAAGLTAPFVPIYTQLRRDGEGQANEFARTVLSAGVLVMVVTAIILIVAAPWIGEVFAGSVDASAR